MPSVLITGITGQDGSYLAEQYLERGWHVHGVVRRTSNLSRPRIDHLFTDGKKESEQLIRLHYGELQDISSIVRILTEVQPDHVVNLAAQSHVGISFEIPIETGFTTGIGAASVLEACRIVNPQIRIYQASSSEMYGGDAGENVHLSEESRFNPKSPYAASKVFAYDMARIYRESYGMHITNGILFNHESPRRGENFVSRKITIAAANISLKKQSTLHLGNLDAYRDWGHARDYMRAVYLMLVADEPDDYVVATGKAFNVADFAKMAFQKVGLNWEDFVEVDQRLFRPNEVKYLLGDPKKITSKLGWRPETSFHELVSEMVESDLVRAKGHLLNG
jgi:GDPmannose 4,6-dehydratase